MRDNDDRYKNKIRKLLALASSDNEFEAERARAQATIMMKKHNIREDGIDIRVVESHVFEGKNQKLYHAILIDAISQFSGCEPYFYKTASRHRSSKGKRATLKWTSQARFMGVEHDAKIASYTLEVLVSQLNESIKKLKRGNPGIKQAVIDNYATAWAFKASEKVIKVFGHRPIPTQVQEAFKTDLQDVKSHAVRQLKSSGEKDLDMKAQLLGIRDGDKARLNIAAEDDSEKTLKLGLF